MEHCHLEEPKPVLGHLEMFQDDSRSKEGTFHLVREENSQEIVLRARHSLLSSIIQENFYKYPMWPTPLPSLASFIHAHQAHPSKPNLIGATGQKFHILLGMRVIPTNTHMLCCMTPIMGKSCSLMSSSPIVKVSYDATLVKRLDSMIVINRRLKLIRWLDNHPVIHHRRKL